MSNYKKKKEDEIIEYLREWLKDQTVFKNRKEIAQYLHISYSHLNNIINGWKRAGDNLLQKIAIMTEFDKQKTRKTSLYPGEERSYMDFAEELRKWFSKQNRWKTQREMAEYLGVPLGTFKGFFQGRKFPKGVTRKKLFEVTGIKMLEIDEAELSPSDKILSRKHERIPLNEYIEEIDKATKIIQQQLDTLRKYTKKNRKHLHSLDGDMSPSNRFAVAFYALADELLSLRDSGFKDRQEVREKISPKDVGYVISFLKALYDEDKFSDFIFFTKYEFEKGVK